MNFNGLIYLRGGFVRYVFLCYTCCNIIIILGCFAIIVFILVTIIMVPSLNRFHPFFVFVVIKGVSPQFALRVETMLIIC